jgi:hypothetical protein
MDYQTALKKLDQIIETWKPEGETAEVLYKAADALRDCIEMGLNGKGE